MFSLNVLSFIYDNCPSPVSAAVKFSAVFLSHQSGVCFITSL